MPSKTITPDQTRACEERITLDAPAEVVWRALTDAQELMRWFPLGAEVVPGAGGSVTMSW
jgi:uncharacterized protein YndB with AHSA1/START domain